MDEEISRKLNDLFKARHTAEDEAKAREAASVKTNEENWQSFVRFVTEVARPVMEDFSAALTAKGVSNRILDHGLDEVDRTSHRPRASIRFNFMHKVLSESDGPNITASMRDKGQVGVSYSTIMPGKAGDMGNLAAPLTVSGTSKKDFEKIILDVLSKALQP